jgi:hypothetical protein
MPDEKPWEHTVPEGVVTVAAMAATLTGDDRAARHPDQPRLEIRGALRIRGRDYTIHMFNTSRPGTITGRDGAPIRWTTCERPYHGGYRHTGGKPIGRETQAHQRLCQIEREALDAYAADHPTWADASRRLALEYERRHRLDLVDTARRALLAAEAQVRVVERALVALSGTVTA